MGIKTVNNTSNSVKVMIRPALALALANALFGLSKHFIVSLDVSTVKIVFNNFSEKSAFLDIFRNLDTPLDIKQNPQSVNKHLPSCRICAETLL